ncbi:MAG: type I methionyl aminopeptidase [Nitrospinae bacterium]|nr:type I methionyl aminopeptidase [Nitrospinota bacterium]
MNIVYKSKAEIEKIRASSRLVAETLQLLSEAIQPGRTTIELDRLAESCVTKHGAVPAFKGYRGFPASVCVSINEEVVHGIPSSSRRLEEGDIVSLDFGVLKDGYYGDGALTVPVGEVSDEAQRLLRIAHESLYNGIAQAKEGAHLGDISHAIQQHAEGAGYFVVRTFVGHGIGAHLHEAPQVPNFGPPGQGPTLRPGMVLAIEPMVNAGTHDVRTLDDQWTVVTADRSLSAHFEHTVAITNNGTEILTQMDGGG